eukprot:Clim_evm99s108 gene=Clim_evmTU99s108
MSSGAVQLVQYVVVRKDLIAGELKWPVGALLAQACHATTAALAKYREHPETEAYIAPDNLAHMRKIVLSIESEENLKKLVNKLQQNSVDHYCWLEEPEKISTALATRPYHKPEVESFFKGLKLFR